MKIKNLILAAIPFLPIVAGSLALGGDTILPAGATGVNWQTIITIWGPLPLAAAAFYCLIRERDKQFIKVIENYNDVLNKYSDEMKETATVLTQLTATTAQLCVEVEKTRVTAYQMRDMAMQQSSGIWEPEVRGNTRILPRHE